MLRRYQKLADNQAGFRHNRSFADQIATLRIIFDQSLVFNSSLYAVFTGSKQKVFDSQDRAVLWNLMGHDGIPENFITTINEYLYKNAASDFAYRSANRPF